MTAILGFLGSAVFRWLLEKVFTLFERKQDHTQEIERMRVQADVDAAQHQRNLEMLETQSRLKLDLVKEEVRGAYEAAEGAALIASIENARPSGIWWVDAWNSAIRPFICTVCVALWVMGLEQRAFKLDEFDYTLIAVVIGWYFGTRALLPGKK